MEPETAIKRRNPEKTRARILAAAKETFAREGYAQTGLRDIAKSIDVSPSLLVKYFGTKANLFEAALHNALDMEKVLGADKKQFGKTLVQAVLDPEAKMTISAMISLSVGDPEAAEIAGRFTQTQMVEPIAKWLGPPKADARANLIVAISTGFVMFNRFLITGDSYASQANTARWLENTIQGLVDGREDILQQFLSSARTARQ